jgi:hypothetical protein
MEVLNMKKLILTLLAIVGLQGSQAQGAAQAVAFGAKAWQFMSSPAFYVPMTGVGVCQAIYDSGDKVANHAIVQTIASILASPKAMKMFGLKEDPKIWDAKPWYSKAWYGVNWFDDATDALFGRVQKYVGLYGIMSAMFKTAEPQADNQVNQANTQPTQADMQAYLDQQAAEKQAQPQPQFPGGRYGRKGAAGRRA